MSQSELVYKSPIVNTTAELSENTVSIPSAEELRKQDMKETWQEVVDGIKGWRFWWMLALGETKKRYTRTAIGPFWTSLNLGLFIGFIGTVFSVLWKTDVKSFLPYFTAGYISWVFISSIITDSCLTFIAAENLLKNLPLNYTYFAWELIARNVIVLAHHFSIYLIVAFIFQTPIHYSLLLLFPALVLICLTGFAVALILGILCARYRDIKQLVSSLLQISMFCTPVLWSADQFKESRIGFLLQLNPFYHYVKIFRDPLIGHTPELSSWLIATTITIIILCIAFDLLARHFKKLVYWL